MNKSQIFKAAHQLAKSVHVAGDCYRVTFGAALKIVIAESKAPVLNVETFMNAFKAESLNACMANWKACGVTKFDADIAEFEKSWAKTHSDARHARNRFVKNFFEKDLMSVCGFHGLNEEDLNALVDVFGLDINLKNKLKSRKMALIAKIKEVI